jgi:hypothetical protein
MAVLTLKNVIQIARDVKYVRTPESWAIPCVQVLIQRTHFAEIDSLFQLKLLQ